MLKQGITRDMFLVACDPCYHQVRYLVITAFSILGRCVEDTHEEKSENYQRIQHLAVASQHRIF